MARPELRFVPLLGALSIVLVVVGYLVAGDTPDHHALGPEIRADYDNETRHQIAAFLSRSGPSPCCSLPGTSAPYSRACTPLGACRRTSHWRERWSRPQVLPCSR
jgi:hypothetical protein